MFEKLHIQITTVGGKTGTVPTGDCKAFYDALNLRDTTKPFAYEGHIIECWRWSDSENWRKV